VRDNDSGFFAVCTAGHRILKSAIHSMLILLIL
jgi:hypothetical protein